MQFVVVNATFTRDSAFCSIWWFSCNSQ